MNETCTYPGHEDKPALYKIEGEAVCQACYRRYKRNGTLKPKDMYRPTMTEERILAMRTITHDDCWLFTPSDDGTGSIDSYGYGRWYESDRYARGEQPLVYAHRWAFEHWIGPIPEGLVPDHTCHDPAECNLDNECSHRKCFNPAHLDAVTPGTNIRRGGGAAARNARRTACDAGHEYIRADSTKNYWHGKNGKRMCIDCYGPGLGRGSHNRLKETCPADHEYTPENTYIDPNGNRHCRTCRRKHSSDHYYRERG